MSRVVAVKDSDRASAARKAIDGFGFEQVRGREVLIKPNFNTADPAPGSTHNDTLLALVDRLWELGAGSVSLAERSYPPTAEVMARKGIVEPLKERQVEIIDLDGLSESDWVEFRPRGSHWPDGFRVARPILEADCLVEACCVKTHQHGGVMTMALKLAVGVVPTYRHGYDYMKHLHNSPHQRRMIAEINQVFKPELILMDGVEAFVDGGPDKGTRKRGDLTLAADDRVAIDAVGLAGLKMLGANRAVMETPIFAQEQIVRAVELGLGAGSPGQVEVVAADQASQELAETLAGILRQG